MLTRTIASFTITEVELFKQKMLNWANRFNIFILLDNHHYNSAYNSVEYLLAVNAVNCISDTGHALQELDSFITAAQDWLFGHINYDFKNQIAHSVSAHFDGIGFPDIFLFQPETLIEIKNNKVMIACINSQPENIFASILEEAIDETYSSISINIQSKISKQEYINSINKLQQHILRGDCYEINFCQEFFAEETTINPVKVYNQLSKISPAPFASFYKLRHRYLICASPERFLKKTNNKLISQPIKGTFKRDTSDIEKDENLKQQLLQSEKEKSENVMIVDLVRNDLSRICKEGSVMVEELFGIHSFPQVHQLISTISGEIKNEITFSNILKATFPMGSMTGAPKKRVIELIEEYEKTKRGIYSGCVGYIDPCKDFDFNVVIRSIMYNAEKKYLSYQVGSGITFKSDAVNEYNECLLKAAAIKKVLQ